MLNVGAEGTPAIRAEANGSNKPTGLTGDGELVAAAGPVLEIAPPLPNCPY